MKENSGLLKNNMEIDMKIKDVERKSKYENL